MGFEGSGGICMDGVLLNQEDEFHSFHKELQHHGRLLQDGLLSESPKRDMSESPGKDCESLMQEILHLEKQLQNQFKLRQAFESCLGYNSPSSSEDEIDTTSLPESAMELIQDVTELEFEVGNLEQYFLSLYRQAFIEREPPSLSSAQNSIAECSQPGVSSQQDDTDIISTEYMSSDSIKDLKLQCQSSFSEPLVFTPASTPEEIDAKAAPAYHSLPRSTSQYSQNNSENRISLAKHLGTRISDLLPETPNRLSEDMIKCMSAIYCKLSDPPLTHLGLSSRNSCSSSHLPHDHNNVWTPALSFEDVSLDNPYKVEGLQDPNGPYSTLVEVSSIYTDDHNLGDVEHLLQDYRSIISRLEGVDPRKLTHEEKLAFWINIHNSLVMNAFIAFGIPNSNQKRASCINKATYNIGGHSINADTIESFILKCRMSHPVQRRKTLISSRSSFKTGDEIQAYAIDNPEPLLHFALTSGSHSDPAVHAYTPIDIFHELATAKSEYIRATLGIIKNRKILLPKLVGLFFKDSSISQEKVLKRVLQSFPESLAKSIKRSLTSSKSPKTVEWVPHNFSFRYLISKELAKY